MSTLERVITFLKANHVHGYLVGGTVRDELLGRADLRDIDISVQGNASQIARTLANAQDGAYYQMDAEHNVARVLWGRDYVDLAELRGSLEEDLATRDFTINAMARSVDDHEIIDPFGGRRDLEARQVRALSDAVFRADPVRLLRAVRIARLLGLSIESQTVEWIKRDAALVQNGSTERARDELFKILALVDPAGGLRHLDALGILDPLIPELAKLKGVTQSAPHTFDVFEHSIRAVEQVTIIQAKRYADIGEGSFARELEKHFAEPASADHDRRVLLRWTVLAHDIGKPGTRSVDDGGRVHFYRHEDQGARLAEVIMRRMRLSNREIDVVTRTIHEHLRPAQLARSVNVSNRAIYRFFRDAGAEGVDVCVMALADFRAKAVPDTRSEEEVSLQHTLDVLLHNYYRSPETVIRPVAVVNGRDLIAELRLEPGPQIGELLEAIREAQVSGQVKSRDDALSLARRRVRTSGGEPKS